MITLQLTRDETTRAISELRADFDLIRRALANVPHLGMPESRDTLVKLNSVIAKMEAEILQYDRAQIRRANFRGERITFVSEDSDNLRLYFGNAANQLWFWHRDSKLGWTFYECLQSGEPLRTAPPIPCHIGVELSPLMRELVEFHGGAYATAESI
jgi:hypothetical protein